MKYSWRPHLSLTMLNLKRGFSSWCWGTTSTGESWLTTLPSNWQAHIFLQPCFSTISLSPSLGSLIRTTMRCSTNTFLSSGSIWNSLIWNWPWLGKVRRKGYFDWLMNSPSSDFFFHPSRCRKLPQNWVFFTELWGRNNWTSIKGGYRPFRSCREWWWNMSKDRKSRGGGSRAKKERRIKRVRLSSWSTATGSNSIRK